MFAKLRTTKYLKATFSRTLAVSNLREEWSVLPAFITMVCVIVSAGRGGSALPGAAVAGGDGETESIIREQLLHWLASN
jgi:hypothetical protein